MYVQSVIYIHTSTYAVICLETDKCEPITWGQGLTPHKYQVKAKDTITQWRECKATLVVACHTEFAPP